jgi:ABC-type sugar transport system ATPase subunit
MIWPEGSPSGQIACFIKLAWTGCLFMKFSQEQELIRIEGVSKHFGVTKALQKVDFSLHKGEVMGLAGHNGAGKSVLIKIMGGIYKPDSGRVFYGDSEIKVHSINDAQEWGLFVVPQELNLARKLSVAENIFLGRREFAKNRLGVVNRKFINDESKRLLKHYFDLDIDPRTPTGDLDTVTQRIVQVVRCLRDGAKVVIFDETTAGLALHERDTLFGHIKALTGKGLGIIFVSHMISEMLNLCDTVTTLRSGRVVGTNPIGELDENKLVELIVGKEHKKIDYEKTAPSEEILFSVKNASAANGNLKDISFDVRKGEILGIYGLRNQGQGLLMDIIYGAYKKSTVEVAVDGKPIRFRSPTDSVRNGVSFLPERGYKTVFKNKSIVGNMIVQTSSFKDKRRFVNKAQEKEYCQCQVGKYCICGYSSLDSELTCLSGGNMQKVLLARTMAMEPKLLMLVEPTQGIDIGAKEEVKKLILQMAKEGSSVIVVTSEIDDIIEICNRTIIIREGRLKAIFNSDEANKSEIVKSSVS